MKDCGAACLTSVAANYGLKLSIARVRQLTHTDLSGATALGLVKGLEKLGFNARGVKGGRDALTGIPLPAIAHLVIRQQLQHYVVIYRVDRKKVHVMDPAHGAITKFEVDFICIDVYLLLEARSDRGICDTILRFCLLAFKSFQ